MNNLMYLYTSVVILAAALTAFAVWAPRALWAKIAAVCLSAFLMVTAYASQVELLGKPKPVDLEWAARTVPDAQVLSSLLQENEAIYLWLRLGDEPMPRAYALPWSMQAARDLHQATQDAQAKGTGIRMQRPFEPNVDDEEPRFYAEPQAALPPKTIDN